MKDCDKIQPLLIDFVDKTLNREKTAMVSRHLETCKACREEADGLVVLFGEMNRMEDERPDESLSRDFREMLEQEKSLQQNRVVRMPRGQRKIFLFNFSQLAAAVIILLAGMFIGSMFNRNDKSGSQVAELQQEMKSMKEMLILSKLQQPMASQRVMAASYLQDVETPDNEVLDALIKTMNNDENGNVRMAAMNALARYRSNPRVADALVGSLSVQTDPIIQISLINILVEMKDKRAVDQMKQIINDNSTNESVKKLAEEGVLTLI